MADREGAVSTLLDLRVDDVVLECEHPFRQSGVCLACLHGDGRLSLLTGDWDELLGYRREELNGRPVGTVLAGEPITAGARFSCLLDPDEDDPVLLDVRTKLGAPRTLRIFRRFDPYEPALFLACEPFE